jgi:hypothetical protein
MEETVHQIRMVIADMANVSEEHSRASNAASTISQQLTAHVRSSMDSTHLLADIASLLHKEASLLRWEGMDGRANELRLEASQEEEQLPRQMFVSDILDAA